MQSLSIQATWPHVSEARVSTRAVALAEHENASDGTGDLDQPRAESHEEGTDNFVVAELVAGRIERGSDAAASGRGSWAGHHAGTRGAWVHCGGSDDEAFRVMPNGALLSECGAYRYRLWRIWDDLAPVMVWVMLNPSTADADEDDPTIRKCVGFAKAHHHGGIIVVNLFAWRATDPKELPALPDYKRVGPENDEHIQWAVNAPILATIVGGWGAERFARHRATTVRVNIQSRRPMHCFGKSKDGQPKHPLYLPYTTPLERLEARR